MSYSESEPDLDLAINSASNFAPIFFESKSQTDFSLVLLNLNICIFFHPTLTLF